MKRVLPIFCFVMLIIFLAANQPHSNNAVDLLEAYMIASAEAMKWDKEAKPYFITSVDDTTESKFVKGENGKRNAWNFDFVVDNTNKHLILTIHNAAVVNKIEAESNVNHDYIINIDQLHLSTAEAAKIAKEKYGLLPGTDWAQGYHFVLENDGSMLILSVVGRNADGAISRVFFFEQTGAVIR